MKKSLTLLFILIGITSFAQLGQIVNGGFETWINEPVYENPDIWKTSNDLEFSGNALLTKSTDANDGNFSARLNCAVVNDQDTITSYVYHGFIDPNGNGPQGGVSYSDNFEAFMGDFKGDLQAGDTLNLLMIRYLNGNAVDFQIKPVLYGTQTTWTTSVIAVGNQAQDSLFIGFILGDPNGGLKPQPSSWAQIDNIRLLSGGVEQTALPNNSFENWSDKMTENPYAWYSINYILTGTNSENVTKSTDVNSGSYAAKLQTFERDGDTIVAYLSVGAIDVYNGAFANIPYNATPTTVSGSYKYTQANGDNGELSIVFYQGGSAIGFHSETFTAQSTYTNFSAPLTIAGTPDSILILVRSGENPGSILLIDDLSFSGGNVSLDELLTIDYEMYPNPAQENVSIRLPEDGEFNVSITNVNGQVLINSQQLQGITTIDLHQLDAGVYFVNVYNEVSRETKRLIVK